MTKRENTIEFVSPSRDQSDFSKTIIPFIQKEKKPLDLFHRNLFKRLAESREKQKKERFQQWLHTYTYDDIIVKEILIFLIKGIKENLDLYGYKIIDEKKLRDEVASFVYRLS